MRNYKPRVKRCKNCKKKIKNNNKTYCSNECYLKPAEVTCQNCGKVFYHHNKYNIRIGNVRFCGNACKNKGYKLNASYFSGELTPEKLVTLGQLICTSYIYRYNILLVYSDEKTLQDIRERLSTDVVIKPSDRGLGGFKMWITSEPMVNDLFRLGVPQTGLPYAEYPEYDVMDGLFQTACYKEENDKKTFSTLSYKLAREVAYIKGGEILTKIYNETSMNLKSIMYIVEF